MAYFPHAFLKVLSGINGFSAAAYGLSATTLTAGQLGVVSASTKLVVDLTTTPTYAGLPLFWIAQGSFYTTDKIGPFHGGYQETVKTKGINPKYVSKFYVTEPAAATNNIIKIDGSECSLACNTTYRLRVGIKGSPALRLLKHNAYLTVDGFTGCCDDSTPPSDVDAAVVFLQWKDQLLRSEITKPFINPKVWVETFNGQTIDPTSGSATYVIPNAARPNYVQGNKVTGPGIPENTFVVSVGADDSASVGNANLVLSKAATSSTNITTGIIFEEVDSSTYTPGTAPVNTHIDLIGAYVDTRFGDCSFSPMDHFEIEPVLLYASFVEESGDPCAVVCFETTETQVAFQGKGYGEPLLRDLILAKRYRQEHWSEDPRMREILGDTSLSEINRSGANYFVYHILHSVPRKSNPSGVMDSDQYLVKIITTSRNADFETFINTLLASANTGVQLEVIE